jgi:hypothetical protein
MSSRPARILVWIRWISDLSSFLKSVRLLFDRIAAANLRKRSRYDHETISLHFRDLFQHAVIGYNTIDTARYYDG